jgi:hypothetical protein
LSALWGTSRLRVKWGVRSKCSVKIRTDVNVGEAVGYPVMGCMVAPRPLPLQLQDVV